MVEFFKRESEPTPEQKAERRLEIKDKGKTLREQLNDSVSSVDSAIGYLDNLDEWFFRQITESVTIKIQQGQKVNLAKYKEFAEKKLKKSRNAQERADIIVLFLDDIFKMMGDYSKPEIALRKELAIKKAAWEKIREGL